MKWKYQAPQAPDQADSPDDGAVLTRTGATLRVMFSRTGIGLRLLVWIVLLSSLAALLSTLVQLNLEFHREVKEIEQRLEEIGPSTQASFAASLWNLDKEQIRRQLDGILLLPSVSMAEVRIVGLPECIRVGKNSSPSRGDLVREFAIHRTQASSPQLLGTLHVEASLAGVYGHLSWLALEIMMAQGLQTFVVSFSVLLLFHRLVTRHLIAFAAYLRQYDPLLSPPRLELHRTPPLQPDELDLLVESFRKTSNELFSVNCELADANAALEEDLAQRQIYEDQLYRRAHYDGLTGLANRVLIVDRLQQAVAAAERSGAQCAVLLIDLDDFKSVNDSCGHSAGDQLLQQAAQRLGGCHRPGDSLARMGGDEFLIMLPSIQKTHAAQRVAERVMRAFAEAFEIAGQTHFVTVSVGIAVYPGDGGNAAELLSNAESTMYRAKDLGRNRSQFFTAEINDRIQYRVDCERRLRGAVGRGEFVLHYQPIYAPGEPSPAAFEALLRWRQPDGRLESPANFIPLAEDVGLIEEIGDWAMETACRDALRLRTAYPTQPRICVNVSPRQLRNSGFAEATIHCLQAAGLSPQDLEVEITEGVVVDERPEVVDNLVRLTDFGIRLSIDDFGTGYSSLGYLQRYPFRTLKVDRSFVREIGANPAAGRLVEAILNMARGLELETIAEGVETAAQRDFLLAHGCDLLQGFLLGRPVPLEKHLKTGLTPPGESSWSLQSPAPV